MINVMHSLDKPLNEGEKCLDPQLWHACAGGMAQIPLPNTKVYYFPQGHAEHANKNIDFFKFPRIPPLIPCQVSSINYLADPHTDEVFVKIRLVPSIQSERDFIDENGFFEFNNKRNENEKPNSFAKTLTQSDANNGGGFSVPRYCAETIFPGLDYSSEPPVQTILARDVQGQIWKFRHIYRGTPRRHLLTTGWGVFVNSKRLVAGDSVVFVRAENSEIRVGIRRAKPGIGCGPGCFRGLSSGEKNGDCDFDSAVEAVCDGRAFEVIYYPRAGAPEFVVRASAVRAATRVRWGPGIRFKMAFEMEDSSWISCFLGSVSSVGVDDPTRWPNSYWRILEVLWDEPDLLHNVKRVNPWSVELVSNVVPSIRLSPLAPPWKRPRQHPSEFPLSQQFPIFATLSLNKPLRPNSPSCCIPDIQGARHAQFGPPSGPHCPADDFGPSPKMDALITESLKAKPVFVLFGQPILTERQVVSRNLLVENRGNVRTKSNGSGSGLGSAVVQSFWPKASSDEGSLG